MLNLLRSTYYSASAVSFFAGLATTASMFIAERATQSTHYWMITIVVSLCFALAGLLLLGIARQLAAIGVVMRSMTGERGTTLMLRWNRLAAYMLFGGMALLSVLLFVAYAIVARIDEGLAVFG